MPKIYKKSKKYAEKKLGEVIYTLNYLMNDDQKKYEAAKHISNTLLYDYGINIEGKITDKLKEKAVDALLQYYNG